MFCKGCMSAFFCSRECQKSSWYNGHREECRRLAADLRGKPQLFRIEIVHMFILPFLAGFGRKFLSNLEPIFETFQVGHDMKLFEEDIAIQKAAWASSNSMDLDAMDATFVIQLNYASIPLCVRVTPLEKFKATSDFGGLAISTKSLIDSPGSTVMYSIPHGQKLLIRVQKTDSYRGLADDLELSRSFPMIVKVIAETSSRPF